MTGLPWTAALLGVVCVLDDAVCVSLLLSEPVFAGALFGAATGRFETGVACGALLQCLWIVSLRVGGARPPEGWLAALAAVSAAPAGIGLDRGAWLASEALAPALLMGVACAYAGAWGRAAVVRVIARQADRAMESAAHGDFGAIERLHAGSVALHAGRGALMGFAVAVVMPRLATLAAPLHAAAPAGWIALALAVVALGQTSGRTARWTWAAGGVAGLLWAWR